MLDADALLEQAKSIALRAAARVLDGAVHGDRHYRHDDANHREIKAGADTVIEREILAALATTGLPILSEEAGALPGRGGYH